MENKNVNLQISIKQIVDLILQLPKSEQENIIKRISTQKEKTGNRYTEFSGKINGFHFLEQNWDSYNADTISDKAIKKAISVLDRIIQTTQSHSIKLHVFPMRNGGIQFELDNENLSFEIEIDTNGILKFIRFDEEGNILEEINNFEINILFCNY